MDVIYNLICIASYIVRWSGMLRLMVDSADHWRVWAKMMYSGIAGFRLVVFTLTIRLRSGILRFLQRTEYNRK